MRQAWRVVIGCVLAGSLSATAEAQGVLSWAEVRDRFERTNPTLQAGQFGIDESRAAEITAFLRPNPQAALTIDQIGNTTSGSIFSAATLFGNASYLHERAHKRELRRDSAEGQTSIAVSEQQDVERNLLFTLRGAFVQVLQAKAFLDLARENLSTYDQTLALSRDRLQAGDISQLDLDRLELQRVTYESDVQTAAVNVRTAKIQLLRLLNDQTTPVEQFDVAGTFDFRAPTQTLDDLRALALNARPDLRATIEAVDTARINNRLAIANGSTDPTFSVDANIPSISQVWQSYQPPLKQFVGFSVGVPLRVFDRNQGEKLRTQLDVTRNERLVEAARLQVFADVDTAYAEVTSSVALLQPYKDKYLDEASRIRDTITFSYQRGGVSLIDFLQSQQEYRTIQIGYVNLVAAFLNAVNQLNFAIGQEAVQ